MTARSVRARTSQQDSASTSVGYLRAVGFAEQLITVEREGWDALVAGHGGEYYRQKLTEDALMAFPFGVLDRDETIAAMESAPPWDSYEMTDQRVVELTGDCGVVVYRVRAQRPGQEPFSAVVSSSFVRENDDWKLAFHQQSFG